MIDYAVIWTRRDGSQVPLEDMEPSHILNAVALLKDWRRDCRARGERDTARELDATLSMFKREVKRRVKASPNKIKSISRA